jgi:hypothetical protein
MRTTPSVWQNTITIAPFNLATQVLCTKINDLKRLKKTELLKIANDSNVVGNCQSMTNCQITDKLLDAGLFKGVCPPDVANECRLTEVELCHQLTRDLNLCSTKQ